AAVAGGSASAGAVTILEGDNLVIARTLPAASFTLVYLDPPFNTGRAQERQVISARRAFTTPENSAEDAESAPESRGAEAVRPKDLRSYEPESAPESAAREIRNGFHGHAYERVRGMLRTYDDRFDDYGAFLLPRLE